MSEVVQFPHQDVRNWIAIEKVARKYLLQAGTPAAVIDETLRLLKPTFDAQVAVEQPKLTFSAGDNVEACRVLKAAEEYFNTMVTETFGQALLLALQLAVLRWQRNKL